jgi:hypothetical protein
MSSTPFKPEDNIVQMPAKPRAAGHGSANFGSANFAAASADGVLAAGSPDDPRVQEALRLVRAFLAIEDAEARGALVSLAERLVSQSCLLDARKL